MKIDMSTKVLKDLQRLLDWIIKNFYKTKRILWLAYLIIMGVQIFSMLDIDTYVRVYLFTQRAIQIVMFGLILCYVIENYFLRIQISKQDKNAN